MPKYNPENERIKHEYLAYLSGAQGNSVQTIDSVAKALDRFESHAKHRDFKTFHLEQARGFRRDLANETSRRAKGKLSIATQHQTLAHLKQFFHWLADHPAYKDSVRHQDADYFRLSLNEERVARAKREKAAPSVEQVRHVIAHMPSGTDIQKRNRAVVAFALLTGARDNAIASMMLKDIDLAARRVDQDPRHVRTKFAKTFATFFSPSARTSWQSSQIG